MHDVPTLLAFADARERVLAVARESVLPSEALALEAACGRFLAQDVHARHDLPPFTNAAMDGYALRGIDLPASGERRFRVIADAFAGAAEAPPAPGEGECVRIMTGAPMPPGADTVVIRENVRVDAGAIVVGNGERAGANVRIAGEECPRGARVLAAGTRLGPAQIGLAATCGHARLLVANRPRVAVFSTGDELVAPGEPLDPGRIPDSNRVAMAALLREDGIEPARVGHLRDDRAAMAAALHDAAACHDVIVCSGGVSAGAADFLPGLVAELGTVWFWKVRIKPGMPLLFGRIGSALVFALPGNPVSTIANFVLFVLPALHAMQGAAQPVPSVRRARLAEALGKRHDRTELVRVRLDTAGEGALVAVPLRAQGSGMLTGIASADALAVVPEATHSLEAGATVDILPLRASW